MRRPIVLLTGGGTAGHVSVNEALIPVFQERGYVVHYVGSHDGIEKELITTKFPHITYHAIQSGKLRRYFSLKNFTDPFRVGVALFQALKIIRKLKPDVIFSKGGFVSVPVVLAGQLTKTPVVIHESDVTPGLANKLAIPFATHIFTVFEQTLKHLPDTKSTCTGAVIRPELFTGNKEKGLSIVNFSGKKPILIVMGGSQGAKVINETLREQIDLITKNVDVIHLCGQGHLDKSLQQHPNYKQFEYVTTELPDLLAAADFAVSRAGSNAIFELLAIEKPMLLIPLSAASSRGDQILNANFFKSLQVAKVLKEEEMNGDKLVSEIFSLIETEEQMKLKMKTIEKPKSAEEMADLILKYQK